jgi:FkbM family methyltransferase
MRGLSALLKIYDAVLPKTSVHRIADFDGDLSLEISLRDCIGVNLWHAPEQYEWMERRLFCSAIQPGSRVLDIGANAGVFTLLAAKRKADVFSIEADPKNASALRRHVALNGFNSRVTVFEMAAADSEANLSLYRNETNSGGSTLIGAGIGVPVQCRPIDSLNLPPINVCKIDVEGFEFRVLNGMTATLARSPNMKLLIEYSEPHGQASAQEMLKSLRRYFERVEVVGGGLLGPDSTPPSYCNLWCTGRVSGRHAS